MARVLEGRPVADAIWARVEARAAEIAERLGRSPSLAIVVGQDEAAQAYTRQIERAFSRRGLTVQTHAAPETTPAFRGLLARLSAASDVDGLVVMAPLPSSVEAPAALQALGPDRDVDGQHAASLGRLVQRRRGFVPSTALGGLRLLEHYGVPLRGTRAVVVGRSPVVGLPLALLLIDADATVTVCHTRTMEMAAVTREADLLCVAAGRAGLIGPEHVRPGATVLDFGTNPTADGKLVGDVQTDRVAEVAGAITPVPGGTGPVTVAVLAEQTVEAAQATLRQT